jgi:diaminohydroxyphosphoribosylaminopyrimidine deaminase/5-amino-6-(5-phosphoribosylamino)uracil reductase
MRRALALARRGKTSPNPMVGAVIVKDGRIVGEGYHRRAGEPHAEVIALRQAGNLARGAELYVTLEPCCHFGQTPPCSQAVIASGVAKVVTAMVDPNPKVSGKGIAELEAAGVKTSVGLLGEDARKLNEAFIKFITTGLPFVTLKMAMTLDGKIATSTGDSQWVSCEESRQLVHRLRERTDAILVGVGTVLADDPALTARNGRRMNYPARIVVDSHARTPITSKILSHPFGETILAVTDQAKTENIRKLEQAGARILQVEQNGGHVDLPTLLHLLGSLNITNLLIEGGGIVAASALSAGIVDKVMVFIAPKIVGGESAKTPIEGSGIEIMSKAIQLKDMTVRKVGCDILVEAYPCLQD